MRTVRERGVGKTRVFMPSAVLLIALAALFLTLGTSQAQVSNNGDDNHTLGKAWCRTFEAFAAKYPQMLLPRDGDCPTQGDCDIAANRDAFIPDASSPMITIRLRFHVFREDDGSNPAATQAEVDDNVVTLNSAYADFHVRFIYTTEFVDDSEYRYMTDAEMDPMKTAYADDPAHQCNIFVVTVADAYSQGTFAWSPDALTATGGVVMHSGHFDIGEDVLAHEIGHNFGLWHTFHGVSESPDPEPDCDWGCYEHAHSNSDITGDFCSDTPPTPKSYDCFSHPGLDACTDDTPWAPTWPENYMSYGGPGCWNDFSSQQMGRMRCWIDAKLMSWTVPSPVAQCTDVTVDADENCQANASIDNGSYHPDGTAITLEQFPPGPYPLGSTPVSLIVTDANGLADTCQGTVTVVDVTPPVVICPADVTIANDVDLCSAVWTFAVVAADNCSISSLVASPASGSAFPLGTTDVTVTATDGAGNTATCLFQVTVVDTQAPEIICPPDYVFECDAVGDFGTPTATDNCDLSPTITLVDRDSIAGDCPQEYQIVRTFKAEDDAGNTASCVQTISVEDTTSPEITCPDPDSLEIVFVNPNQAQVVFEVTATDNCDDDPHIVCDSASGSIWQMGDHTVTCVADDGCGNADTCSFSFHLVYLDIKPTSCPNPLNVKPYGFDGKQLEGLVAGGPVVAGEYTDDAGAPNAVFPVAILGTELLDVRDLMPETITINGVAPLRWAYEDVATPAYGVNQYCGCTTAGRDGHLDLTLKFSEAAIVASLGPVANGDVIQLLITGDHVDRNPFFGGDCVLIRGNHSIAAADEAEPPTGTPATALISASPNPFNPVTTLSFTLSQPAHYSLTIYNIAGQVVKSFEGMGAAGLNQVTWDASPYASGMYFYRLNALGQVDTKKLLLLK